MQVRHSICASPATPHVPAKQALTARRRLRLSLAAIWARRWSDPVRGTGPAGTASGAVSCSTGEHGTHSRASGSAAGSGSAATALAALSRWSPIHRVLLWTSMEPTRHTKCPSGIRSPQPPQRIGFTQRDTGRPASAGAGVRSLRWLPTAAGRETSGVMRFSGPGPGRGGVRVAYPLMGRRSVSSASPTG